MKAWSLITYKSAETWYIARGKQVMKTSKPVRTRAPKRSIIVGAKKTSIRLEEGFWEALREIVKERQTTLQDLITGINAERRNANLSSVVRVFILDYYAASKRQDEGRLNEPRGTRP
jgi:predicted DNA-binding ribbon-helix-helix protein